MAEQVTQSPLQPSPQVLAALFPQMQQQAQPQAAPMVAAPTAAAPAPATPPAPDITQEMIEASRAGRQAFGAERDTSIGLGSRIEDLSRQQEAASGSLAFHPNFHGGFLHNLGQALLTIGAATRPGQAVQNVVYSKPREEYAGRAKEIETLRGQQEESEKRGTAAASMVSKPITAAAQVTRSEAMQQRADAYSQKVQNDLLLGLKSLDLKAIATGAKAELDKARAVLDRVNAAQAPLRTDIMKEGVELGNATRSAIENVKAQLGLQADHPLSSLLDSVFGTTLTPAAPQTDTGKTGTGATVPPAKPPAKAGAAVPKGTTVYDPQGQPHRSDGTHPLPKGWSLQKPGA